MKFITHSRDKAGDFQARALIHIPIGIIMSIPVFGWGLIPLFIYYEHSEDYWTHDFAWKDVYGSIVGFVLGIITQICTFVIIAYRIWG